MHANQHRVLFVYNFSRNMLRWCVCVWGRAKKRRPEWLSLNHLDTTAIMLCVLPLSRWIGGYEYDLLFSRRFNCICSDNESTALLFRLNNECVDGAVLKQSRLTMTLISPFMMFTNWFDDWAPHIAFEVRQNDSAAQNIFFLHIFFLLWIDD